MDKGLTVPKWVLIVRLKIPQMPQNLSSKFVCPSPKFWDFNEKRLYWVSIVPAVKKGKNRKKEQRELHLWEGFDFIILCQNIICSSNKIPRANVTSVSDFSVLSFSGKCVGTIKIWREELKNNKDVMKPNEIVDGQYHIWDLRLEYLKRFWNGIVIVLVLVLNFESFFCELLASVGLVNKNGCKDQH